MSTNNFPDLPNHIREALKEQIKKEIRKELQRLEELMQDLRVVSEDGIVEHTEMTEK